MVDRIGIKRMYEAEVICLLREMRQQLAHPHAVLSRLRKLEHRRRHQLLPTARHGRDPLALADGLGQLLSKPRMPDTIIFPLPGMRRWKPCQTIYR